MFGRLFLSCLLFSRGFNVFQSFSSVFFGFDFVVFCVEVCSKFTLTPGESIKIAVYILAVYLSCLLFSRVCGLIVFPLFFLLRTFLYRFIVFRV